jgi:REP element-mobilizing transposase RayT
MSHSSNNIWVHLVFTTKYRAPLIKPDFEERLFRFIAKQLIEIGCFVEEINGVPDHIHILFRLSPTKSISEVTKKLKGSSSFWVNDQKLSKERFSWQTGYFTSSVSEFYVEKIKSYIKRQKEHHGITKQTTEEELLYLNSILSPHDFSHGYVTSKKNIMK